MKLAIIAYIPVVHRGVMEFLEHKKNYGLYIIGESLLESLSKANHDDGILIIGRDNRALKFEHTVQLLAEYGPIVLDNEEDLQDLFIENYDSFLLPDEDITRLFAEVYLSDFSSAVSYAPTFLRLDLPKSLTKTPVDCKTFNISDVDFIFESIFRSCKLESKKSSCWLRQVGSVIFNLKNDQTIIGHNHHMPHEYQPYIMGDPRANLEAGEHTEISTSCHSEMSVVAKAARSGIRIDGSSIIVTTFPCPTCAMLIAEAGIKQVFFIDGYSSVNSLDIFKKYEIEIFQIIE